MFNSTTEIKEVRKGYGIFRNGELVEVATNQQQVAEYFHKPENAERPPLSYSQLLEALRVFRHLSLSSNKIEHIKNVRMITGWGLKEAKEFTETAEYRTFCGV